MNKTEEKKSTVKTTAAKKSSPAKAAKPKATAAKKTAAKKPAKAASKSTAKKTAVRKPKPITIDNICTLVSKKIVKTKAAAVKTDVAVDIEVWGFADGSNHKMYIEIKGGKATVMPHSYDAKDFRVSLSFANAMDFANGKITLAKLIDSKDFYAEGNIVAALKLASIF